MTYINARIIADSVAPHGVRLTSFEVEYPRFFHPEVMTHRAFARNFSSHRAIPIKKLLNDIDKNPAEPLHIGQNQAGMQAYTTVPKNHERAVLYLWNRAKSTAIACARDMFELFNVHKQVASRVVEPWTHIRGIITSTDFENFFALRCHPAAEPHIRVLAWKMADAYYRGSTPQRLEIGEWHLPYVQSEEYDQYPLQDLKKFSAARCARVSYRLHDGHPPTPEKDLELYRRLVAGLEGDDPLEPGHLSPFEHQATPSQDPLSRSGPFRGWHQYRKEFPRENMHFDYEAAVARGWREDALSILKD